MAINLLESEAEILGEVISPGEATLSRGVAKSILQLRFSDQAQTKLKKLLQRNNADKLSERERERLDSYLRVGQFLDLMQAKARVSLH